MSVFSLLLVGSALASEVSEVEAQAQVTRIEAHYSTIQTLQAGFTQTVHSTLYGAQVQTGTVTFGRPGRMNWTFDKENKRYVSDGQTLWIHDPVAKEVQVLEVGAGFLSGAAIQFLLGEGRILETFRVTTSGCQEDPVTLVLHPKEPATYEKLELVVDPASGSIRETEVIDLFGNRTRVRFEDMKTNQDPPSEIFRFEPPEGVRVLELPPTP